MSLSGYCEDFFPNDDFFLRMNVPWDVHAIRLTVNQIENPSWSCMLEVNHISSNMMVSEIKRLNLKSLNLAITSDYVY